MRYIIYGKNLEVTEGLKQAVHDKFSKLEKFFTPETEVQVTLSVQKDNQIVEATIPMKGTILRVEPNSTDMYVSIDMAVDLLERMIRKYKTKISKYGKGELKFNDEFMEEDVDNHETVTITKSKRFAIKPMDVEEACVQMELLGHNFFVFRNAETFEVNVVYKRKDKTYGLIEPEFQKIKREFQVINCRVRHKTVPLLSFDRIQEMYFLDSGYEMLLKKYMELLTKEEGRYFLSAFPFSVQYSVY